jgi:hypothetical protein
MKRDEVATRRINRVKARATIRSSERRPNPRRGSWALARGKRILRRREMVGAAGVLSVLSVLACCCHCGSRSFFIQSHLARSRRLTVKDPRSCRISAKARRGPRAGR